MRFHDAPPHRALHIVASHTSNSLTCCSGRPQCAERNLPPGLEKFVDRLDAVRSLHYLHGRDSCALPGLRLYHQSGRVQYNQSPNRLEGGRLSQGQDTFRC